MAAKAQMQSRWCTMNALWKAIAKRHVHDEVRHRDRHDVVLERARELVIRQGVILQGVASFHKVVTKPHGAQGECHDAVKQAYLLAALSQRVPLRHHDFCEAPQADVKDWQTKVPAVQVQHVSIRHLLSSPAPVLTLARCCVFVHSITTPLVSSRAKFDHVAVVGQ